jgi:hypothetical protein
MEKTPFKKEEKSVDERRMEMVVTAIANSTVAAVKAAAIWMPDTISPYKEQKLLEEVIGKLQNSV